MNISIKKNLGFSIVEVILAITVFTISVIGIGLFLIDIMMTAERAQNLNQAVLLADEGLEAVRAIRDNDIDDIDEGTFGIVLVDDTWSFNGDDHDVIDLSLEGNYGNVFERSITIEDVAATTSATTSIFEITSQVSWPTRSGTTSVSLYSRITNWDR